jgi:integrase
VKGVIPIPIYKTNIIKNGLQKYIVRINYISDSGQAKQLSRVAYGSDKAKTLEMRLLDEIKNRQEMLINKITVQELFDEYIKVKTFELRQTSIIRIKQAYNYFILPVFKDYQIDKITLKGVQDWKLFMESKNLALSTKRTAFTFFNSMINYAIKMEYLNNNPLSKIGNFKDSANIKAKMIFYTSEEFKEFITSAKKIAEEKEKMYDDLSEWNYYIFFNIAFYTGLRKGEIHALKWSDINGSYLSVNRSISQRLIGGDFESAPKNKSSIRILQMPKPLIDILIKHKQRQQVLHNFTDDFRICNSIRDTSLRRKNQIYSLSAGIKTIRVHDFRHSHASLLANSNINIQEISRRLGHAQIEITWNTYCHLYPREEEKAVSVLNNSV